MKRIHSIFCLAAILLAINSCAEQPALKIFAAASLTEAVQGIAGSFEKATGEKASLNFASAGILARQIEAGAPCDVFISANVDWVTKLAEEGLVDPAGVVEIARNSLVLIAKKGKGIRLDSLSALEETRISKIAVSDPSHSPAGIYAKEALTRAGLWERLEGKLLPGLDVRAALAYVANGEADIGIVYLTDARIVENVEVVFEIPAESHSPIIYQAAAVSGGDIDKARRFLEYLRSADALGVLERLGFKPPSLNISQGAVATE